MSLILNYLPMSFIGLNKQQKKSKSNKTKRHIPSYPILEGFNPEIFVNWPNPSESLVVTHHPSYTLD